jgi:putative membrane protein
MIVRPRLSWFRLLFVWRGSVLRSIVPQLVVILALSAAITAARGRIFGLQVPLTIAPFTLLGVSLAIFLGFRNSASYDRFWEGRKLWGSLFIVSRSLARQVISLVALPEGDALVGEWVELLAAFTHALRHQLRGSDPSADLRRLLPAEKSARLLTARCPPAILLVMLGQWVEQRKREQRYGEIVAVALDDNLGHLSEVLGGCERLATTPLPYPYSVMIHRTVYIYCFLLPFALVDIVGWMTPLLSVFTAYTFMALEALAAELAEPFGTSAHALALVEMSQAVEDTLLETTGRRTRGSRAASGSTGDYLHL